MKPVNFEEYFSELFLLQEPKAQKKHISLKSDFSFDRKEGNIDKVKVKQIIDNLISNAFKFSPENSRVTVTATTKQNQLLVMVKDEGLGIPKDEQYKVFAQGEQISTKPTAGESTHGLGLTICKQIADALKGELSFESEPNKGTTFVLKLPLS